MSWRTVLQRASAVDLVASKHVDVVLRAIDDALANRRSQATLCEVHGAPFDRRAHDRDTPRPARDARAHHDSSDVNTLAAVRGVSSIVRVALGAADANEGRSRLDALEAAAQRRAGGDGAACARCGFAPIETHRERELGDVVEGYACPACGHAVARRRGRAEFYTSYTIEVCEAVRAYEFDASSSEPSYPRSREAPIANVA